VTAKFKAIEDLSRYPDWTLQVANIPAAITCTDVMAEKHPELVVAFMKGMIKVGPLGQEHKRAAAAILDKQTFYAMSRPTYEGIKPIDLVPEPLAPDLVSVEIGKGLHAEPRLHQNDFDVKAWPRRSSSSRREELLEQQWRETTDVEAPEGDRTPVVRAAGFG